MAKKYDNLIPFNKRTENERRALAKKGGQASGRVRKKKQTLRQLAEVVIQLEPQLNDKRLEEIEEQGINTSQEPITHGLLYMLALAKKAAAGDIKAIQLFMQLKGEDPQSVIAKERLDFDKERLKAITEIDDSQIDAFNNRILRLADLINHPEPDREIPE